MASLRSAGASVPDHHGDVEDTRLLSQSLQSASALDAAAIVSDGVTV